MESKWYPYGKLDEQGIRLSVVAKILDFASVGNLPGHGSVVKVVNCEGLDLLRFEDGTFSVPIERVTGVDVEFVPPAELFRLGIINEEQLKEIQAEELALREEEAENRREQRRADLLYKARRRLSEKPQKRLGEIEEKVSRDFLTISVEEYSAMLKEALDLNQKLLEIEELPPELLLTPDELEHYHAL